MTIIKMNTESPLLQKVLQGISNVFHPLLMLTYAAIAFCYGTYLFVLPQEIKLLIIGEVFLATCLVPVLCITVLYKFKVVGHWALRDRNDRALPLLINFLSYAVCTWVLYNQGLPSWALSFYIGATLLAFVCWLISFWWKISAHTTGISGFAMVSFIVYFHFPVSMPLAWPLLLTVLTGLLGSIRVYLGRHTLMQVTAGTFLGAVGILLSYWLFA